MFFIVSTSSQSVLARKKGAAESIVPPFFLTKMEALRLFQDFGNARNPMQKRRLWADLHWEARSPARVTVRFVTRAWRALTKSAALGSFESAYSTSFVYDGRMALLQVMKSRSGGFSPLSQHISRLCFARWTLMLIYWITQ